MDNSKSNHHQHLRVNKIGKSIQKSPIHQPSFQNQKPPPPQQSFPHHNQQLQQPPPQPQVYNISKNDFRSIVQQLTGTPSRDPGGNPNPPPPRPPQQKPPSMRLQKIRPPPLTPIARPPPPPFQNIPNPNPNPNPNPSFFPRPVRSPTPPAGAAWADSPVSAYMRYLESSLLSADSSRQPRAQLPTAGLLPSPRFPGPGAAFSSPRSNPPPFPPPHSPALLPSPGSQFALQSPSSFLNLLSPKSPYPLLSPGFQCPPPLTPNFAFSPWSQSGILGPGPGSQLPPSPGLLFPPSPSGFFPIMSPRWREM